MDATYDGDVVWAGRQAREQFYDARGYGRPADGGVVLRPVEAAHLLYRGDLPAVTDESAAPDGDGRRLDFRAFLASTAVSEVAFFAYKDLRDRGFYLSPSAGELVVYSRGKGPWDDAVAYRVRPVGERTDVPAAALRDLAVADDGTGVLAVVDEESELTYLELAEPDVSGSTSHDLPAAAGDLLADRVLVWEPPEALHDRAFYGQPLDDDGPVQLSLVEAAYLAGRGRLSLRGDTDGSDETDGAGGAGDADDRAGDEAAVIDRGRAVEGDRFDRRLRVYTALRTAGVVPKTGYKFGADFRTYDDVGSVEDLGHSSRLVRVLPAGHDFAPRDLALDVRLAGGVRKRMVFALTGANGIHWLSASRLTP